MSTKRLYRSPDSQLFGVCAGVATYFDINPKRVRIGAILLSLFTSAPVLVAYIAMVLFVPMEPTAGSQALETDHLKWSEDAVHFSYTAPIVPHLASVGTSIARRSGQAGGTIFAIFAAIVALLAISTPLISMAGGGPVFQLEFLAATLPLVTPLFLALILLRRQYAMTCSHDSLWLERPFQSARRIHLSEVERIIETKHEWRFQLCSGELVTLPTPAPSEHSGALMDQLKNAKRRALAFQQDLTAAKGDLRQLEQVMLVAQDTSSP